MFNFLSLLSPYYRSSKQRSRRKVESRGKSIRRRERERERERESIVRKLMPLRELMLCAQKKGENQIAHTRSAKGKVKSSFAAGEREERGNKM